jgi:epoxyqueuosine reductase
MLRNVCVALGNWADPAAFPGLDAAADDETALARGHAAWALGELLRRNNDERAAARLHSLMVHETDAWVREEIGLALGAGA